MKLILGFFIFGFLSVAVANQSEVSPVDQAADRLQKATDELKVVLSETSQRRQNANYFVYGYYSFVDLLIPNKIGLSAGAVYDNNKDKTWEFEYLQGSIAVPFIIKDLGKISDQRMSVIWRSYFGSGSFNFSYGLAYHKVSMTLGDALLSRLTGGTYPGVELVEVSSVGPYVGIGNRWIFTENISFGVDWLGWSQPLITTSKKSAFLDYATNQQDRDDVDSGLKIISYFPRFIVLKLHVGIWF